MSEVHNHAVGDANVLLSIVVPFYNSALKSERLVSTLSGIKAADIQIVCVDDGSTDLTLQRVREFAARATVNVSVISQNNRGPGGARNTGLRAALGQFVWFVDSDDDIDLAAIDVLREHRAENFDFIDFNFSVGARNAMFLHEGIHEFSPGGRANLVEHFGSLCTKIFSREFVNASHFAYPERCYFEDNALFFTLALCTRRFYKSECEFYKVHLDFESVTRGVLGPRFYDRLYTAVDGATRAFPMSASQSERTAVAHTFRTLFLSNSCRQLFGRMRLKRELGSAFTARNWGSVVSQVGDRLNPAPWLRTVLLAARIIRHYRNYGESFGLDPSDKSILDGETVRFRRLYRQSEFVSRFLPDQRAYFDRIRHLAWAAPSG